MVLPFEGFQITVFYFILGDSRCDRLCWLQRDPSCCHTDQIDIVLS